MKLFLLSVVCLVGTTFAVPITRTRRDILPGDPRYGTDYHHQHHHHQEVEMTKAVGGYMYTIPASSESGSQQLPHQTYGVPFQQVSEPLKDYQPVVEDVKKTVKHDAPIQIQTVQKQTARPATTYGAAPVLSQQATQTLQRVLQQTDSGSSTSYRTPIQHQQLYQAPQQKQTTSTQYLAPAVQQSYSTEPVHQVEQVQQVQSVQHVQQVQPVQYVQQVQPVQRVQQVQPVQHVQQVQPVQRVQHVQQVQQPQPEAFKQYGPPQAPVARIQRVQESRQYIAPAQKTEVTAAPLIQDHVHFQRFQTYQSPQPTVQTFNTFSNALPTSYQTSDLGSVAQFNTQELTALYDVPSAPLQVQHIEHQAPLQVHHVEHQAPLQVHHVEHQAPLQVQHVEQQFIEEQAPVQVHQVQQQVQQVEHVAPLQEVKNFQAPQEQTQYLAPQVQQVQTQYLAPQVQQVQTQYLAPQVQEAQTQYVAPQVQQATVKETIHFEAPVQSIEIPISDIEAQQPSFPSFASSSESVKVETVGKASQPAVQVNSQNYSDNGGYVY